MKYVRHETKGFFLFPRSDRVFHSHIADFLGRGGIVSAGFVRFDDKKSSPICFGKSESIGIGSLPEDTKLLREQVKKCPNY